MFTTVHYTLADGTKGYYNAPSIDAPTAIALTKDELADDGETGYTIIKTELVRR